MNRSVTVDSARSENMHMKVLETGKPVRNIRMKTRTLKGEDIVNVTPVLARAFRDRPGIRFPKGRTEALYCRCLETKTLQGTP